MQRSFRSAWRCNCLHCCGSRVSIWARPRAPGPGLLTPLCDSCVILLQPREQSGETDSANVSGSCEGEPGAAPRRRGPPRARAAPPAAWGSPPADAPQPWRGESGDKRLLGHPGAAPNAKRPRSGPRVSAAAPAQAPAPAQARQGTAGSARYEHCLRWAHVRRSATRFLGRAKVRFAMRRVRRTLKEYLAPTMGSAVLLRRPLLLSWPMQSASKLGDHKVVKLSGFVLKFVLQPL